MKVCHYILVLPIVVSLLVLTPSCGNTANNTCQDTDKAERAIAPTSFGYDVGRAKELCDKYSAGLLSEENYLEAMDLVETAFSNLWTEMNIILDQSDSDQDFEQAANSKSQEWQTKYKYADYLAKIIEEATPEQLGEKGSERMHTLNVKMQTEHDALNARRTDKYNN